MSESSTLILIGYRGTGKTTVGRLLAEQLAWTFIDADDVVEAQAGCTIADIFAREGEVGFRDRESRVVAEIARRSNHVVSIGGGAVLRAENRAALLAAGNKVVWLTASPQTIFARVNCDATTSVRRPNLTTRGGMAEIEELLATRRPLYEECAQFVINTEGRTPTDIAVEIRQSLDL